MGRIHLNPTILGQLCPRRHLHHMRCFKPRVHAFWQRMELAMPDIDEVVPRQRLTVLWIGNLTASIDSITLCDAELMGGDSRELCFELFCRMEARAAHHDCHTTADWRVRGQARKRIRSHHTDQIRIDLKHLAYHCSR